MYLRYLKHLMCGLFFITTPTNEQRGTGSVVALAGLDVYKYIKIFSLAY